MFLGRQLCTVRLVHASVGSQSVPVKGRLVVPAERNLSIDIVDTAVYPLYSQEEHRSMKAQMVKWGNSLAVRIPKPLAEQARLKEGDALEIEVVDGRVELRRASKVPTLAALVSQITPENRYAEVTTGAEVGKEVVEW